MHPSIDWNQDSLMLKGKTLQVKLIYYLTISTSSWRTSNSLDSAYARNPPMRSEGPENINGWISIFLSHLYTFLWATHKKFCYVFSPVSPVFSFSMELTSLKNCPNSGSSSAKRKALLYEGNYVCVKVASQKKGGQRRLISWLNNVLQHYPYNIAAKWSGNWCHMK